MAIAFVAATKHNASSGTTSPWVVPDSAVPGDLCLGFQDAGELSLQSVPTGWTKIGDFVGSSTRTVVCARKIVDPVEAGDSDTSTVSNQAGTAVKRQTQIVALRGVLIPADLTTIPILFANETTSQTNHTAPSISVTTDGWAIVHYAEQGSPASQVVTKPTSHTERAFHAMTGGSSITAGTYSRGPVNPAANANGVYTSDTATSRVGITIASFEVAPTSDTGTGPVPGWTEVRTFRRN